HDDVVAAAAEDILDPVDSLQLELQVPGVDRLLAGRVEAEVDAQWDRDAPEVGLERVEIEGVGAGVRGLLDHVGPELRPGEAVLVVAGAAVKVVVAAGAFEE